ncbi:hypothetical protein [Sphaerisporangium corydalis]|uniref:Uncharacterized protein n=1 Tax=Sphaerisporangium corydalis TaxID=1441875 RepID=A0ABV9EQ80_9ACTN|nr:hypothetical protein [Sphaerisporangium corydalis]
MRGGTERYYSLVARTFRNDPGAETAPEFLALAEMSHSPGMIK